MPPPDDLQTAILVLLGRIEIDESVEMAVRAWGPKAMDILRQVARGKIEAGPYERANAAYLLGVIQPPKADADLTHIAEHDAGAGVRLSALGAIRRIGGQAARALLLRKAADAGVAATERMHALVWLAEIGEHADLTALGSITIPQEDMWLAQQRDAVVDVIRARRADVARPSPPADNDAGGPQQRKR